MSHVVQDLGNAVSNAVNTVANDVSNVVETAVNNPIPIIEVVAVTLALGPEGLDLSSNIGAPATAAVSNAAVVAANGGNVDDIAKAAAAAAVGSYVSTATGTSVAGTAPDATTTTLANITGSAAGSAAQTAIMGGNASTILQNALAGGAAAGTAAGASALGAGTTTANVLGGAVGGGTQAGGNTLSALTGAAGGAARSVSPTGVTTPPSTPVASTYTPDSSVALVYPDSGQSAIANASDFSTISTQTASNVAGLGPEGLPDPANLKPNQVIFDSSTGAPLYKYAFDPFTQTGQIVPFQQDSAGNYYYVDPATGQSSGATQADFERAFYKANPQEYLAMAQKIYGGTGNIDQINQAIQDHLTKLGIANTSGATPVETIDATVSSAINNIVKNIDISALSNSAYSENAAGALSSPIIQNILQQAGNQSYVNEILQNIASGGTQYADATYYKNLLSEVVQQYPQLNTAQIQNILTPPLIPLTQGTINSLNVPNVDVTNIPLPPGVPSDAVISINPVDNSLVFYSASQDQTYNQTGQVENPQAPTTTTSTNTSTVNYPTVGPQTPSSALTTALNLPTVGSVTSVTTPGVTTPNVTTPSVTKPGVTTPSVTPPGVKPPSVTFPTVTPPTVIQPPEVQPPEVQPPIEKPPTGPSTEKTKLPSYTPDVFVYGNVPKALAGGPFAQVTGPAPGESVGLGGGGGGVNVESGKEQAPVWNIASLKLKPGEEETADYSNLSSALGI